MATGQQPKSAKTKRPHPSAVAASMPSVIDPMLPTLVRQPFSDPEYLFEPKLDGWRALCFVQDGQTRFLSRKGHSLTERFPETPANLGEDEVSYYRWRSCSAGPGGHALL